jgi:predicted extracellular nuclease
MFVQDDEGPWNGIVCFEYDGWQNFDWVDVSGNVHPGPGEGDEFTLTGTIEEYYNLTELVDVSSGVVHGEADEMIEPSLITASPCTTPDDTSTSSVRL